MSTDAPPSPSTGITELEIRYGKRKKRLTAWMAPDTPIPTTKNGRIIGRQRAFLAAYFEKRGMVSCIHKYSGCMAVDRFPDLLEADYDHLDGIRTHNIAGNFGPSCAPCNKKAQGEQWKSIRALASAKTERENIHANSTKASSKETEMSYEMRPRWLLYIRASVWKGQPGPLVRPRLLDDLCQRAPRDLARDEIGEESLGNWKTYQYSYVPMDLESRGGPLKLERRMNKDGKTEVWVKLAQGFSEALRVVPAGQEGV